MHLSIVLVLGAVCASQAMILCPPNACATVRCAAVTDASCDGRVAKNGGFCGCCDSCVAQIKEGENCRMTMLLGAPARAECVKETFCHRQTAKCEKKTCIMHAHEVTARLSAAKAAGTPLLGLEVPMCAKDGSFSSKQCTGSRCYCVSETGEQIQNFGANRWEANTMDCGCARDMHKYVKSGLIGRLFKCDAMGSYSEVQCTGSVCYCAAAGKQLDGMSGVHISAQQTLDCKKALCAKQYTTTKARLDAANAAGAPLLGLELPKCLSDGTYHHKQCRGSQCMCTEEGGQSIGSYRANRWESDNMDCSCALAEHKFSLTGLLGKSFNCASNGSYAPVQCMGSSCFCVDVGGKRVMATQAVHVSQISSLKC